ncbi:roadblock/LC7 domain-containing protein [Haliangium sp.]|uniref:roadblock/LC7 domain-containing protein n=1 Tax=Haliangium sp. TaxID=2663208 RepID=UPI003D116BD8
MGLDGIPVDTYVHETNGFDVNIIVMEFSYILTQVTKAAETLKVGAVEEMVLKAEQLVLVVRMLNEEYFMAVALRPGGNLGKCRFLMRITTPKLMAELM